MSKQPTIHTIDLKFQGIPNSIAAYLIPHAHGAVLVECGPGSTLETLEAGLAAHGLTPSDITDVLVSHIHLDHAGAAGWFAQQGARIHVHHVGAPHIIDPTKLLRSATRIYGDMMDKLWGEYLPVPEERVYSLHDNDEIEIEGLVFRALDTPGHAYHHIVYRLGDICFTGDVGGVRITTPNGLNHFQIPAVPPELNIEKWRTSIRRLANEHCAYIAPTHFGIFDDPDRHLRALQQELDAIENWMENTMPLGLPIEELRQRFTSWAREQALKAGLNDEQIAAYEAANPPGMSADGIQRYWKKYRHGQ
ncbi:MAG: MBL fold metallo-hydrolase [Chloroflexota bacterium]|nr:MBL fold metallo-hydrolase [Chloroflexota bacterium]